ncbi:MAG: amidase [Rhodospirillaceae bacterium]|nr:amidase [Rhodospirillaceae bacterium]
MNVEAGQSVRAGLGVAEIAGMLARGETTSAALTDSFLARIAAHDRKLNSFIAVTAEMARAAAAESDARRARGQARGPLDGVPIALKDNIDLAGVATTAGIDARRKHVADSDAPVTARLKAAGAVILGKLNMHEGAHGATTANEAFGFCTNPHREGYTPGGSSGGSGAAVAAGLCAAALGTDTLGSIRIPSSFCGIAGIKPTQGLVSARGVVPLAHTLDHVGPMAPRVADLAPLLEVMAGRDPDDPFSAAPPRPLDFSPAGTDSLKGLRLGRLRDLAARAGDALDPDVAAGYETALDLLRRLGADIVDVALEGFTHNTVRAKAMLVIEADLAVIHAGDLEANPGGFTAVFREGVEYGRQQSAPKLAAAYDVIRAVRPVAAKLFANVDALVAPTTPCTAFSFKQPMPKTLTAFTAFGNYAGAPSASVPMGFARTNLPMGLLITARPWADMTALRIAAAYERAAAWDMRPPGY